MRALLTILCLIVSSVPASSVASAACLPEHFIGPKRGQVHVYKTAPGEVAIKAYGLGQDSKGRHIIVHEVTKPVFDAKRKAVLNETGSPCYTVIKLIAEDCTIKKVEADEVQTVLDLEKLEWSAALTMFSSTDMETFQQVTVNETSRISSRSIREYMGLKREIIEVVTQVYSAALDDTFEIKNYFVSGLGCIPFDLESLDRVDRASPEELSYIKSQISKPATPPTFP